jgi:hypothetical protein
VVLSIGRKGGVARLGEEVNGVECYPKGVLKKERLHTIMVTTKDWSLVSVPMVRIL